MCIRDRVKTVIQVLGDANGDLSAADCFAAVISLSALAFAAVSASGEYGADPVSYTHLPQ